MIVLELLERPPKGYDEARVTEVHTQGVKIGEIHMFYDYTNRFTAYDADRRDIGGFYDTQEEALMKILVDHHLIVFKR